MASVKGRQRLAAFFDALQADLNTHASLCPHQGGPAVQRLQDRCSKKALLAKTSLRDQAFGSFVETNSLMSTRSITLGRDLVDNAAWFIYNALHRYTKRERPEDIQQTLDYELLFSFWKFGPGASNGVTGTHTAQKIGQPWSCTDRAEPLVLRLRSMNFYLHAYDSINGKGTVGVGGSRLATVPKNQETERTIAIEPLGNMALQLAAGTYLTNTLREVGLDIRSQQPKNKAMALLGSSEGGFATIDLKSASDMVSFPLVRALMPKPWIELMEAIRSPKTTIPGYGEVDLNMVSTMGNGFTFPLMTLLFTALLYAYRVSLGGPTLWVDWGCAAIFGDDIIVKTEEYSGFCSVLEQAGFIINNDKSFSEGPFRESCGGDYWLGEDITPFYVRSLRCDAEVYVALNQVLAWSARHNVWLVQAFDFLLGLLEGPLRLVPEWHGLDEGLRTVSVSGRYKYLQRVQQREKLDSSNFFAMMLACGGYVLPGGSDLLFTPRSNTARWKVTKARVPKSILDGWDPLTGSRADSYKRARRMEIYLA